MRQLVFQSLKLGGVCFLATESIENKSHCLCLHLFIVYMHTCIYHIMHTNIHNIAKGYSKLYELKPQRHQEIMTRRKTECIHRITEEGQVDSDIDIETVDLRELKAAPDTSFCELSLAKSLVS